MYITIINTHIYFWDSPTHIKNLLWQMLNRHKASKKTVAESMICHDICFISLSGCVLYFHANFARRNLSFRLKANFLAVVPTFDKARICHGWSKFMVSLISVKKKKKDKRGAKNHPLVNAQAEMSFIRNSIYNIFNFIMAACC